MIAAIWGGWGTLSEGGLSLDFLGVAVRIEARDRSLESHRALLELGKDFEHFQGSAVSDNPAIIELSLERTQCSRIAPSRPWKKQFRTRMCEVLAWRGERLCIYAADAWCWSFVRGGRRVFRVYAESWAEMREIAYVALLSSVGEELDLRGFHRVHALGIEAHGKAGLVVLPSGGGKSAIATLLMRKPGFRVFSDEIPLLKDGVLYPFPIRVALGEPVASALGILSEGRRFQRFSFQEKLLFSIPADRIATAAPLSFVCVAYEGGSGAKLEKCSRSRVLSSLIESLVIGHGVPQMAEYMLRQETLPKLPAIAWSRLKTALQATKGRPELSKFQTVANAYANADVLSDAFRPGGLN